MNSINPKDYIEVKKQFIWIFRQINVADEARFTLFVAQYLKGCDQAAVENFLLSRNDQINIDCSLFFLLRKFVCKNQHFFDNNNQNANLFPLNKADFAELANSGNKRGRKRNQVNCASSYNLDADVIELITSDSDDSMFNDTNEEDDEEYIPSPLPPPPPSCRRRKITSRLSPPPPPVVRPNVQPPITKRLLVTRKQAPAPTVIAQPVLHPTIPPFTTLSRMVDNKFPSNNYNYYHVPPPRPNHWLAWLLQQKCTIITSPNFVAYCSSQQSPPTSTNLPLPMIYETCDQVRTTIRLYCDPHNYLQFTTDATCWMSYTQFSRILDTNVYALQRFVAMCDNDKDGGKGGGNVMKGKDDPIYFRAYAYFERMKLYFILKVPNFLHFYSSSVIEERQRVEQMYPRGYLYPSYQQQQMEEEEKKVSPQTTATATATVSAVAESTADTAKRNATPPPPSQAQPSQQPQDDMQTTTVASQTTATMTAETKMNTTTSNKTNVNDNDEKGTIQQQQMKKVDMKMHMEEGEVLEEDESEDDGKSICSTIGDICSTSSSTAPVIASNSTTTASSPTFPGVFGLSGFTTDKMLANLERILQPSSSGTSSPATRNTTTNASTTFHTPTLPLFLPKHRLLNPNLFNPPSSSPSPPSSSVLYHPTY